MSDFWDAYNRSREATTGVLKQIRVGGALAKGDLDAAAREAAVLGDFALSTGIQDRQAQAAQAAMQAQRQQSTDAWQTEVQGRQRKDWATQDQKVTRDEILRNATAFRAMPEDQRYEAFSAFAPKLLQSGLITQGDIDRIIADKKLTNEELDPFIVQLGGEIPKEQLVNMGQGGVGSYDALSGGFRVLREPSQRTPPTGYAWGPDGEALVVIPGGPADPKTIGTAATVRRQATVRNPMPSRARAGGSSRAATTGTPGLPPGFTLDP